MWGLGQGTVSERALAHPSITGTNIVPMAFFRMQQGREHTDASLWVRKKEGRGILAPVSGDSHRVAGTARFNTVLN